MADAPLTVNSVLGLPSKEFGDKVAAAGMESQESHSMKDRILKGMKGLQWKSVQGQVRRKSGELLEVSLMSVITSAWRQRKVTDRLAEENKTPGVSAHVALPNHSIRSEFEPFIEIKFGEVVHKIILNVKLDMRLTGVVLNIEDSIIRALEAGFLEGIGEIKIAHIPLLRKNFGPIDLPGKVSLGKGIPLLRPAGDSSQSETLDKKL